MMIKTLVYRYSAYERSVTWTLVALLCMTMLSYGYFLSLSVLAVVERNHAEREINSVKGRLAEKERVYVDLGQNITLQLASEKGFVEVAEPRYLSSKETDSAFTMRTSR